MTNVDSIGRVRGDMERDSTIGVALFDHARAFPERLELGISSADAHKLVHLTMTILTLLIGANQAVVNFLSTRLLQLNKINHKQNVQWHIATKC